MLDEDLALSVLHAYFPAVFSVVKQYGSCLFLATNKTRHHRISWKLLFMVHEMG